MLTQMEVWLRKQLHDDPTAGARTLLAETEPIWKVDDSTREAQVVKAICNLASDDSWRVNPVTTIVCQMYIADACFRLQLYDEFLLTVPWALKNQGSSFRLRSEMIVALMGLGRFDEARSETIGLTAILPSTLDTFRTEAPTAEQQGELSRLGRPLNLAYTWSVIGVHYLRLGDIAKARSSLERARRFLESEIPLDLAPGGHTKESLHRQSLLLLSVCSAEQNEPVQFSTAIVEHLQSKPIPLDSESVVHGAAFADIIYSAGVLCEVSGWQNNARGLYEYLIEREIRHRVFERYVKRAQAFIRASS